MRVAVDATPLLEPATGIGRVTRASIAAMVAHTNLDVTCYSVTWRGRGRLSEVSPDGAHVHSRPIPARGAHLLWRHLAVPWAELLTGPVDVVHGMNYVVPPTRRAAAVVSVHDLTFLHHPDWVTAPVRRFPALIQKAIDRGAWIHTGAEAIAVEIRDHFAIEPHRVVAIHHGLDPALATTQPTAAPIDGRYVLSLGTIEPRKDHATLVRAFDAVAGHQPDIRLVIAGGKGWAADDYEHALAGARHRDRIDTLGYVPDSERRALLHHASVLAYPSRYEGFGLPPLEAMQVDVPVVTTNVGSLPEVVGDAAEIAAVGDVDDLAGALTRALDPARRAELVTAGRANLTRFDWAVTAARLADLYRLASR